MNLGGKNVLVTGGSGFVGSHIVERLANEGCRVMALSRSKGKLAELPGVVEYQFSSCDLADAATLGRITREFRPEIVFHVASSPDSAESYQQSTASIDGNITGTLNLLEAIRLAETDATLVYADSCKVYGGMPVPYSRETPLRPNSSYAISKAAGWEFCKLFSDQYGIKVVSVRPTLIYGSRQPVNLISFVMDSVLNGESQIQLSGGEQTRSPLYIHDACDAFFKVVVNSEKLNKTAINICGPQEMSIKQIADEIVEIMGSDMQILQNPARVRSTEIWRSVCNLEESYELIGWKPEFTFRNGIENMISNVHAVA